ncbi:MAG: glycosyltransferase family 39 protein [Patescibacteria group bacterium]
MKRYILLLLLILAFHLFLLLNLEFTAWPEILSFPYLKNNGFLLYRDMVHAYPPLLTLALSYYYKAVGYGVVQLKIFTWLGILANNILVFLSVRLLTKNEKKGLLASLFYALTQPFLEGNMLWFDTALATPLFLSFYFLLKSIQDNFRKNLYIFASGLALGTSVLTKQTALAFLLVSFLFLLFNRVPLRKMLLFSLGPLVLIGLLFLRLYQENAISGFFNWTFYYPSTYWTKYPTFLGLSPGKKELAIVLLVLSPAPLLLFRQRRKLGKELLLLLLFLVSAVLAVYPRFSFYHFQPAIAFASVLAGYMLFLSKKFSKNVLFLIIASVIILTLPGTLRAWGKEDRFFGKKDKELAEIIRGKELKGPVYLLGLHSGLYVLSGTLPPKPWVDNFGWVLEIPNLQQGWVIDSWGKNPPGAIFWKKPEEGNWYELGTYQPQKITDWIKKNYTKEEEIDSEVSYWRINR